MVDFDSQPMRSVEMDAYEWQALADALDAAGESEWRDRIEQMAGLY